MTEGAVPSERPRGQSQPNRGRSFANRYFQRRYNSTKGRRTIDAVDKLFADLIWSQGKIIQRKLDMQVDWLEKNPGKRVPEDLELSSKELQWLLSGKETVRKARVMERTAKKEEAERAVEKRRGGRPSLKSPLDPKAQLPSAVDIEELRAAYAQPEDDGA